MEDVDYWHQAHEIEAREQEETLYLEYLIETQGVEVEQLIKYFPNRLMG